MRVVVIDDSKVIRERLVTMLSALSQVEVVGSFESAEPALESMPSLDPELVILDIRLPGASGLDVLPTLRRAGADVYVFTSFPMDAMRRACLAAGATHFLDKSKDFLRLRGLVTRHAQTEVS